MRRFKKGRGKGSYDLVLLLELRITVMDGYYFDDGPRVAMVDG